MAFSDQFIDDDKALDEFKRMLTSLPGYERLTDSQIVEGISLFQSWALRQANWRAERAHQEGFLSTAINRSSVLAHAESKQYVPRKPTPSRGTVALANTGDAPVSVPAGTTWLGDNQLTYRVTDDVVVPAGSSVRTEVRQLTSQQITFRVDARKPFYELVLGRDESTEISDFTVTVDGERWTMEPRLMNTSRNAKIYDEFYTALDEIGIRFGNGVFGRIPPDGAEVVVDALLTRGQTELLPGQTLRYVEGSEDHNIGMLEARTYTTITGGRPREDIEEIRRNALYYPLYDEQLVWRDDYAFRIRRQWPEAVWVSVWGEHEQEQVYGMDLDNIGKIYVSAYAPERPDILDEITANLEEPISRQYIAVPPNEKPFTIRLNATIERSIPRQRAMNAVTDTLAKHYGKNSYDRRETIKLKDFYRLISATGHFEMGDFVVELFGDYSSNGLEDLVFLDVAASEINVGYD